MMTEREHKKARESADRLWFAVSGKCTEHFNRWDKCLAFNTLLEPPAKIREIIRTQATREWNLYHDAKAMDEKLHGVRDKVWDLPYIVRLPSGRECVIDLAEYRKTLQKEIELKGEATAEEVTF